MLELTRRRPNDPMAELVGLIANDPFFRRPLVASEDDGGVAIDVSESDGKLVVRANLPGFKRDEIDVQVHKGVLTIKGEHAEETESKDEKFFRRERRFGAVSRSIALPGNITDEHVDATFENGVLVLRIAQPEAARPKKVAIR